MFVPELSKIVTTETICNKTPFRILFVELLDHFLFILLSQVFCVMQSTFSNVYNYVHTLCTEGKRAFIFLRIRECLWCSITQRPGILLDMIIFIPFVVSYIHLIETS